MYCKTKTDALMGAFGLALPYDIFYNASGKNLKFYPKFIEVLDAYFRNMYFVPTRAQQNFINLFVAFANSGVDNGDGACAALDIYLSTLKGETNA